MIGTKDKTRDKARDRLDDVRPYVERALRDEEIQEHIRNAYESARKVYDRLSGGKGVGDKKLQKELRQTVEELRVAGERMQGRKGGGGGGWFRRLLLAGLVVGAFAHPKVRGWVQEQVFGSGEEFTYTGS